VDTGRQRERTRLAWRRTGLATTLVTLLTARLAGFDALGTALAVLLWLAVLAVVRRRRTALLAAHPPIAGRTPAVLAALAVGFALLGTLVVVLRAGLPLRDD
jgi:hypothetical protein